MTSPKRRCARRKSRRNHCQRKWRPRRRGAQWARAVTCVTVSKRTTSTIAPTVPDGLDGDMCMTAEVVGIRWVWVRLGWYTCARIRPLPSVPTLLQYVRPPLAIISLLVASRLSHHHAHHSYHSIRSGHLDLIVLTTT
ncbi:hypothetical protein Ctob_012599 [Chrysochromulina tobinii]|jgi:hypothetical protein|uniref:Uncharacterized protein n=1 Tax=Chrysochromulina tobinii TaxID=1460289 RepID=A0A0M0JXM9_9EUKA|nr:hypothetical protein Ctob_012599 [Chrysochromulina tobinii]|eukprot:KOO31042.1 hypothetical protein Ctob_012599 [Chrysochromulina sp. CCMP291]